MVLTWMPRRGGWIKDARAFLRSENVMTVLVSLGNCNLGTLPIF